MPLIDFNLPNALEYCEDLIETCNMDTYTDEPVSLGSNEFLNHYSKVSRGYHGIFHICFLWYCHKTLSEVGLKPITRTYVIKIRYNRFVAEFIKGHDVIYDAESKTNEHDSAIFWGERTELAPRNKGWVKHTIEASANHWQDLPMETNEQILTQWALGLDLIPLAAPWEIFQRNQLMIRAEYSHLSDADWEKGRHGFLNKIHTHFDKDRKNIYNHPYLRSLFETNARENIVRSLGG